MDLDTCNTLSSKGKPTKEHRKERTESCFSCSLKTVVGRTCLWKEERSQRAKERILVAESNSKYGNFASQKPRKDLNNIVL